VEQPRPWSSVGVDVAKALARLAPSRRSGVHLVGYRRRADDVFRTALALGAENVAELPRSAELGDRADGPTSAPPPRTGR
jgi:hypothetical protein